MSGMKRSDVLKKLNAPARRALENAMKSAKLRGNPYVELVHWVEQLCLAENGDVAKIVQHFGIDPGRLAADLTASIDALPRGSTTLSDISDHVFEIIERGFVLGAMRFDDDKVRSGYIILGGLATSGLDRILKRMSGEFDKIKLEDLEAGLPGIVRGSAEDGEPSMQSAGIDPGRPGESSGAVPPSGKQAALEAYAEDLTEKAKSGKMDPIVGRDEEIRQMVNILMRRRQNNPILTGEAGVGKTAVVEGFAQRLARGDVPPQLRNVRLMALDIGLMQAGASMKGEFENRLRQVIDEVQSSETPIILFIDEAHTLIGAGGAAGTGDAANLLKPALARGELRTVAATTWAEYKKYIEKDPALTRRFETVKVEEPDEAKAVLMLRGIASSLEKHHRIQILDEALEAAVQLSARYVPARQLPDKGVSLIDTACARVAVSQHAVPPEVEDTRRRIAALEVEQGIIARETAIGLDTEARGASVSADLEAQQALLETLEKRWEDEKALVDQILDLRAKLRGDGGHVEGTGSKVEHAADEAAESAEGPNVEAADPADIPDGPLEGAARDAAMAELTQAMAALEELQGEAPLILPTCDRQAVASVIQDWTGIPVSRMASSEIDSVLNLAEQMQGRVVGQDHAMEMIAKRIQTNRAGLDAENKPIGVFMLAGPSGVGKTETALTLAEMIYGGEQNLVTINMSEFQEAHTVSTLKGAPPGYVGYGEGGVLTEAVRRKPYSVVLLDEVEKAHSDVHEIFFQVFDKGIMEDGEGRRIDFKNTLILLTSNVGSDLIMKMCEDPDLAPEPEGIAKAMRPELLKHFPAALLGRLVVIPYYPLSDEMIDMIAALQLKKIQKRVKAAHGAELTYDQAVLDLIRTRCTELESGGRMIDAILTNTLLPTISREVLVRMAEGSPINKISVTVEDEEFAYEIE
ncbi:type VI secretion system ATPase TssH [Rhodovulum sp. DZ06]|uniref:type VI secretion system ATPase TssH n=1 Tax=Rhodovulum sp. DZ06 TaxID=3425126 RepID=UPI003D3283CE